MTILAHEKQIFDLQQTIHKLKEQNKHNSLWSQEELQKMGRKLEVLKNSVYAQLTPWDRVAICRHPQRPHSIDYIQNMMEDFTELAGDRTFQDDHAVITGLARIGGRKFMVIGQEKGKDTESRIYRNFGMPHPEGYRKALRCMRLADKFNIPIVTLIDTPGAYPGLSAEERGQGWAIANNLMMMGQIAVPIIVVLVGEGCSGGALGIGVGDTIAMLEHSYYSVISPEGCASILWKDAGKNALAAAALKMHPEDLMKFDIIDAIIPEPQGGAHHDPVQVYASVKSFISEQGELLSEIPKERLLNHRYEKFRKMGRFETCL